ncbi:MAG: 2OG-Fe(II) oxygenase [Pseudorhodoplanes sp.]|uniref:2OG-Fe(II) oxygenase n=1 Tax=Pseudorhodoplanes sp. TaxID=1934341 RepID=UPI003D0D5357
MTAPAPKQRPYSALFPGDPAPWFYQRSLSNPRYAFSSVGGRYVVLCFFGSAADPLGRAALDAVIEHRPVFDDSNICFFGISADAGDESENRITEMLPGIRYFLDYDLAIARQYGAAPRDIADGDANIPLRRFWLVLDPTLRVMASFPFASEGAGAAAVFAYLRTLPSPAQFAGFELQAPILILPNVFEPDFCAELIDLYNQHGGEESGFMREVNGKTITAHDHSHKRRKDYVIDDDALIKQTQRRIQRRIVPEVLKVHQFKVTRMERYIVSCYSAEDLGHFRAHRDNTTAGTAHRRFAVSINLNAEFEGGEISFPEYGPRRFKPPVGGACVFSCSLLHEVSPVTAGRRYAFLPFLYDDEAAKLREANNIHLGEGVGAYRA